MEKTEFTQARKKTELLYMLEMMMRDPEAPEEKRNNLKIYIINVDQGPNSCLYTTKTNVAFLTTFGYRKSKYSCAIFVSKKWI